MNQRLKYIFIGIAILTIALIIRNLWKFLPYWINFWIGDFLWAVMLFFLMIAIFMPKDKWKATIGLVVFCWIIEVSQAWHTPWLDTFRSTTFGGLLLGHGFLWSDIIAYTMGALVAYFLDKKYHK